MTAPTGTLLAHRDGSIALRVNDGTSRWMRMDGSGASASPDANPSEWTQLNAGDVFATVTHLTTGMAPPGALAGPPAGTLLTDGEDVVLVCRPHRWSRRRLLVLDGGSSRLTISRSRRARWHVVPPQHVTLALIEP